MYETDADIPVLRSPWDTPPIRTPADLHRLWRALLGPLGFSEPRLWFTLLDTEDRVLPIVQQISRLAPHPDPELLRNLAGACKDVLDGPEVGGGSAAFLLTRPGSAMTPRDRDWARALRAAAEHEGLRLRPIHLGTDEAVRVFAPDDLLAAP